MATSDVEVALAPWNLVQIMASLVGYGRGRKRVGEVGLCSVWWGNAHLAFRRTTFGQGRDGGGAMSVEKSPDATYVEWAVPVVMPFGTEATADAIQEVWDAFVKPNQDAEIPPSVEMRILGAVLRSSWRR